MLLNVTGGDSAMKGWKEGGEGGKAARGEEDGLLDSS